MKESTNPLAITDKGIKAESINRLYNSTNLKKVSTEELINELESRPGVRKISVGLYQPYELKRKYYRERLSDEEVYVEAKEVLIVSPGLILSNQESLNDREQQILNRYIELSSIVHSIRDLKAIKEMAAMDLPLEDIIQSLEICFSSYKAHYPSDKIRTFGYCKEFILRLLKQN
ncbi:hypothetical protein D3C74_158410 [compost metagenome]